MNDETLELDLFTRKLRRLTRLFLSTKPPRVQGELDAARLSLSALPDGGPVGIRITCQDVPERWCEMRLHAVLPDDRDVVQLVGRLHWSVGHDAFAALGGTTLAMARLIDTATSIGTLLRDSLAEAVMRLGDGGGVPQDPTAAKEAIARLLAAQQTSDLMSPEESARAREVGAVYLRFRGDSEIGVTLMTFDKARLWIGTRGAVGPEDGYCYADPALAVVAAMVWTGEGDPIDGWHRHIGSGRRRQDGDPSQETVRA